MTTARRKGTARGCSRWLGGPALSVVAGSLARGCRAGVYDSGNQRLLKLRLR